MDTIYHDLTCDRNLIKLLSLDRNIFIKVLVPTSFVRSFSPSKTLEYQCLQWVHSFASILKCIIRYVEAKIHLSRNFANQSKR